MTPTLASAGFQLTGPTLTRLVSDITELEAEITVLIEDENDACDDRGEPDNVGRDDINVLELFTKTWCGSIGDALSQDGVEALQDWDTAYFKHQAAERLDKAISTSNAAAKAAAEA